MSIEHSVVSREAWLERRRELLEEEKRITREKDALAARRRALPWVKIEEPYAFDTPEGTRTLEELFDGRSQLLVYHFMYGPDWEQGCPSCSFWAESFHGAAIHLAHRDVTFKVISRGPLAKLLAYRERMGWRFDWVSSAPSDFNFDFGVSFTEEQRAGSAPYNFRPDSKPGEEMPGMSAFRLADGGLYHTYSCYARGLDGINPAYQMLDLTSKGRDEQGLPWGMAWVKRHDTY